MRGHTRILAGTALATLMMASAIAMADTRPVPSVEPALLLAQAEGEQPAAAQEPAAAEPAAEPEQPRKPRKQRAERQAPAEEQPAEAAPAEQAAEPEQPKVEKRRKQRAEQQPAEAQPAEAAPAEQAAEPEQPKPEKRRKQRAEQQPAEAQPAEAAPAEQAAEPEQPKPEKRRKQRAEQQPAEAQPAEAAPAEQAAEPEQPKAEKRRKQRAEQQPAEEQPAEAAPAEQAAEPEQPKVENRRKQRAEQQAPAGEEPAEAAPAEQAVPAQPEGEAPARPAEAAPAQQPTGEPPAAAEIPNDGSAAPMLDSQKQPARPGDKRRKRPATGEGQQTAQPSERAQPPAIPAGPPPADDKAAQEAVQPADIQPVTAERGKRRERRPDDDGPRRRERPKGSEVLREIGDRLIVEFNNQVIVESNDRPRMSRGAREVYYEDLPRGRTRETIVRPDGTRVVTVRNAYGDIVRRSRIAPDDREYVLVYVEEDDYERVRDWRDPGLDLPPMRLDIPEDEYILDAAAAEEPEAYYTFLEQPPVERVERLYSVDEVKRSARIRDKTRRVDLDTLTFEFGSSSIPEDQIAKLDGVAQAIEKLLKSNPAETFLIEGHTDAVGSDLANLALSDRRAEAVADALTDVFAIPPENLATQGYGEQYLKVRTQAPERENRRVAIRRITPLVAPVASAN